MLIRDGNDLNVTLYKSKAAMITEEIEEIHQAINGSAWGWSKQSEDPLEIKITLNDGDAKSKSQLEDLFNFSRTVAAFYGDASLGDKVFNQLR